MLYPDAGHAFLFQEGAPFTFLIGTFLTAPPKPLSLPRMRAQFLAAQAPLSLAGKTWNPELKALKPDATPAQVALIDQPFAAPSPSRRPAPERARNSGRRDHHIRARR